MRNTKAFLLLKESVSTHLHKKIPLISIYIARSFKNTGPGCNSSRLTFGLILFPDLLGKEKKDGVEGWGWPAPSFFSTLLSIACKQHLNVDTPTCHLKTNANSFHQSSPQMIIPTYHEFKCITFSLARQIKQPEWDCVSRQT